MRIRKRPPLLPFHHSSPQNPDPSLQFPPPNSTKEGRRQRGLHPNGDLPTDPQNRCTSDQTPSDPLPKPTDAKVPKEEGEMGLDSSSSDKTSATQVKRISWCSTGAQTAAMSSNMVFGGLSGNGVEKKTKAAKAKAKSGTSVTDTAAVTALNTSISIDYSRSHSSSSSTNGVVANGKKRRSPAVLMEGSRCSRVNGRGWRCCQQTLVGYSLCEHHLGKGRLKSVSSVRAEGQVAGRGKAKMGFSDKGENCDSAAVLSEQQEEQVDQKQSSDGEKKGRKKMGTVKARSISSLLDETDRSVGSMISSSTVLPADSVLT